MSTVAGSQGLSDPDILTVFTPDLDKDEVYQWLVSPSVASYSNPISGVPDYSLIGSARDEGQADIPQPLSGALVETYRITKRLHLVSTVDVTVPILQLVTINVSSHLFVRNSGVTDAQRQAIVKAFDEYKPKTDPDPVAYANQRMGPAGVTADMFVVRPGWSLTKKGSRKEVRTQANALIALYGGKPSEPPPVDAAGRTGGKSDITNNDVSLPEQLHEEGYGIRLIATKLVGRFPQKVTDALHEQEGPLATPPDIPSIVKTEAAGLDCPLKDPDTHESRVATIFAFPDFRVTIEHIAIRVGCFTISIPIPVVWTRLMGIVLWAYVASLRNEATFIVQELLGCVVKSALAGAIVGIVLSNFPAAIAAFRVAFSDCVSNLEERVLACTVSGLALRTEPDSDWIPIAI